MISHPSISRLWIISSRILLVTVAVHASRGVKGGISAQISCNRPYDGLKSLLLERDMEEKKQARTGCREREERRMRREGERERMSECGLKQICGPLLI